MKRDAKLAPVLFSIVVAPEVNDSNICNIKRVGSFHVVIEKMKRSAIIQCHCCQRYNHTAGQCNFKFRCVQCITDHAPGNCPRKQNPNLPLGCINCYAGGVANHVGHTANNVNDCQFFKNIGNKQKSSTSGNSAMKKTTTNSGGTSHGASSSSSGSFDKHNNIEETVVANNPHIKSKKQLNKLVRNEKYNIGKSTQSNIGRNAQVGKRDTAVNNNDKMGALISALQRVLLSFS